jgi:uncharacterized protein (DUF952 family)
MSDRPRLAYKVLTEAELAELRQGGFAGSSADRADGFIHLSTAEQLAGTVDRHFAGRDGLWIAAVDLAALGDAVRWEESRGGALFPHLYAPLSPRRRHGLRAARTRRRRHGEGADRRPGLPRTDLGGCYRSLIPDPVFGDRDGVAAPPDRSVSFTPSPPCRTFLSNPAWHTMSISSAAAWRGPRRRGSSRRRG